MFLQSMFPHVALDHLQAMLFADPLERVVSNLTRHGSRPKAVPLSQFQKTPKGAAGGVLPPPSTVTSIQEKGGPKGGAGWGGTGGGKTSLREIMSEQAGAGGAGEEGGWSAVRQAGHPVCSFAARAKKPLPRAEAQQAGELEVESEGGGRIGREQ